MASPPKSSELAVEVVALPRSKVAEALEDYSAALPESCRLKVEVDWDELLELSQESSAKQMALVAPPGWLPPLRESLPPHRLRGRPEGGRGEILKGKPLEFLEPADPPTDRGPRLAVLPDLAKTFLRHPNGLNTLRQELDLTSPDEARLFLSERWSWKFLDRTLEIGAYTDTIFVARCVEGPDAIPDSGFPDLPESLCRSSTSLSLLFDLLIHGELDPHELLELAPYPRSRVHPTLAELHRRGILRNRAGASSIHPEAHQQVVETLYEKGWLASV